MAHFWVTRFTKTRHKMTFSVRHRMKQSNLKLAKHEGTDLSSRNIAIWEVIKHEIMEISIWTCSFPKPFFALWGYKASCQHGDAQVFRMQKNFTACLFFCSINSVPTEVCQIRRVLQRINMTASFLFPKACVCAITLNLHWAPFGDNSISCFGRHFPSQSHGKLWISMDQQG